jgi:hypothetical protein
MCEIMQDIRPKKNYSSYVLDKQDKATMFSSIMLQVAEYYYLLGL